MKNLLLWLIISITFITSNTIHANEVVKSNQSIKLDELSMKYSAQPFAGIITGGQPSLADLQKLKAQGVKNIINLRGAGEFTGYDEAKEAKALGLNYISLEIAGAAGVSIENTKKFDKILSQLDGSTLVHCASSNRVGALFAIRSALIQGNPVDQALQEGKAAGLKSLLNKTKVILESDK